MADNFDNYSMKVQARVDMPSNKDIDAQIRKLEKSISKLKVSGQFDDTALKNLTNQLNSLKSTIATANFSPTALTELTNQVNRALQNINVGNINVGNIENQAQQVGQQIGNNIGQQITQSISSAIQKGTMKSADGTKDLSKYIPNGKLLQNDVAKQALKDFQALGIGIVTVKEEMKNIDGKNLLNGFTINIKNAKGEVESLRYALTDIKGKTGKMFQYVGGSINDNGVIQQMNTISAKADSLQTKLEKLKSSYSDMNASRPIKDSNNISALSQQYDKVAKSIENVRNADSASFSSMVSNAQREITVLENMVSQFRNAENVATQMKSVDISSGIAQAQERLGKLKANASGFDQMKQTIVDLDTAIANVGDKSSLDAFINKLKVAESQLGRVKAETKQLQEVNKIQLSMGVNGDTTSKIEVLRNNFAKLGLSADEVKTKMSGVDTEVKTLQSLMNSGADNSAIVTQFEKLQTVLTQAQNNLKQTRSDYSLLATEQQRLSLANTIEAWNQKNTAATKEVRAENDRYVASLRDLNTEMTKLQFGQIQTGFKQNENSMRTLNKLGASLKDQMKQAANSFTQWISVSSAIMGVVYNTKQAVSELKDLDDILTEISKTSDLTTEQLKNLGDTAFDTASKYGKKASDYLTGVQEMYRAGFDNAEQMAELSVLAQSAGDMDATLSNNYLMATNAAYKYKGSIEDLNNVLDSQNYITNNAAISMKDIADATTETASVAAEFGVQIDELSALIATATANTRESGSEVGTALKAILINLQDTTSKPVTDTFDALGISMTKVVDGAEKLKTPIELIYELADAYNSLPEGDVMRANILNDIGQKRHANTLASILSDMEGYQKMLDLYNNTSANGSAFKEAEKSANNLSGSLNRLSNTWTDTVENIVNSDTLKGAVNLLNGLLTGVNKLTDALGSLGTIGLGAGLLASFKGAGRVKIAYPHLYTYACRNKTLYA